ncbi:MAG: Wzt carbohydrate-binding domain-containing protein, partial [Candidatus Wallbacteria bacterium]|nr:Wzt carbohydrate-binding domain-containing protein [Candidatus Wallbacteria bacterium]
RQIEAARGARPAPAAAAAPAAVLAQVRLLDAKGIPASRFAAADSLGVELAVTADSGLENPVMGVAVYREDGLYCFGSNSSDAGLETAAFRGTRTFRFVVERLGLARGAYYVNASLLSGPGLVDDFRLGAASFQIDGPVTDGGFCAPPCRWEPAAAGGGESGSARREPTAPRRTVPRERRRRTTRRGAGQR